MATETYENLQYNEEKIRLTILTNICRMFVTRGYMDSIKYGPVKNDDKKESDTGRLPIVEKPSDDHINNALFSPFINTRTDNNTYMIPLDYPYKEQIDTREIKEKEKKENVEVKSTFDGSVIVVRLIPQIVKDVSNSAILNDFIKTYENNHKIVVFDGMADKVYTILNKKKNVEVFDRDFFMLDLMSHVCAPESCNFLTEDEMLDYIDNPKIAKIHENDPLARYYNGKKGQILRIIRPSLNNSFEVGLRRIIDAKSVFK